MQIKEVEEKTGITSHNIRYYEKENLIKPQRNPFNGYREYTKEDVYSFLLFILHKIILYFK